MKPETAGKLILESSDKILLLSRPRWLNNFYSLIYKSCFDRTNHSLKKRHICAVTHPLGGGSVCISKVSVRLDRSKNPLSFFY